MAGLPVIATDKTVYDRYMGLPLPDKTSQLTYIWIDGTGESLRSKTRTHYTPVKSAEGNSPLKACVFTPGFEKTVI